MFGVSPMGSHLSLNPLLKQKIQNVNKNASTNGRPPLPVCAIINNRLVAKEKEPITPFISKVRALYDTLKVSSILVIGGCGDYFEVADTVIMMDCYSPKASVTRRM